MKDGPCAQVDSVTPLNDQHSVGVNRCTDPFEVEVFRVWTTARCREELRAFERLPFAFDVDLKDAATVVPQPSAPHGLDSCRRHPRRAGRGLDARSQRVDDVP